MSRSATSTTRSLPGTALPAGGPVRLTASPSPAGTLRFRFGRPQPSAVMKVAEITPQTSVVWQCIEGPDEWKDTTITFELKRSGGETAVVFTQAGWREPVEFMHHCTTKWAYYLIGLKAGLEGGNATLGRTTCPSAAGVDEGGLACRPRGIGRVAIRSSALEARPLCPWQPVDDQLIGVFDHLSKLAVV